MFFKLHDEHRIGYKKLSTADLGTGTSHQTHIGLYEDVLNYLPNSGVVQTAMLIYNDYCDIIDCYFDRIENPDGTFRSPKIRVGETDSVARRIRDFASKDITAEWYLIWFGLDSQELVFLLLNNNSSDFKKLQPYLDKNKQVIDESHPAFPAVLHLIEEKVDMVSVDLQEELEVATQVGRTIHKFHAYDIEKAKSIFAAIGRQGEELVAIYLDKELHAHHISYFQWVNSSRETGLPYDFVIDEGLSTSCHIDVKSTNFKFAQPIVFSNNEIDFIQGKDYTNYQVYRLYNMNKATKALKICTSFLSYAQTVYACQLRFRQDLQVVNTKADTINYAVPPTIFKSEKEIML